MKFYRMEVLRDDVWLGIYTSANPYVDVIMARFTRVGSHPEPQEDFLLNAAMCSRGIGHADLKKFRFGFSTIDQLLEWFPTEILRELLNHPNATVRCIEIDAEDGSVLVGNSQSMIKFEEYTAKMPSARELELADLLGHQRTEYKTWSTSLVNS